MNTLRSLFASLALLLAALPAVAEPAEAPPQVDLTPAIPVVEVRSPKEARMHVLAARGAAAGVARSLAGGLAEERRELETLLGGLDAGPMEIRFAYGREEFAALQPRGGRVPGWAAGVAWPSLGLVVIDAQASGRGGDVRAVLRHELAHIALGRLVQGPMPRWFTEGFAQLYAGEWTLSRSSTLARATVADALIPVRDLDDGWPAAATDADLAYAQSVSLVSFLAAGGDGTALQQLVRRLRTGEPFGDALAGAYGQPPLLFEVDWKHAMKARYGWLPFVTDHNLLMGAAGLLFLLGAWRAHVRKRRRIEAMADDESAVDLDVPTVERPLLVVYPAVPQGPVFPRNARVAGTPEAAPVRTWPDLAPDEPVPPPHLRH